MDGLDLSPQMIHRARAKVPESRFVVADAAAPAFPAAEYDVGAGLTAAKTEQIVLRVPPEV